MKEKIKILAPIITQSKTDLIQHRLTEYFKEKSFKPGDSIPSETELSDALGVSRNAVREALSRFRMLGLIETRTKRGMVLANPNIINAIDKLLDLIILSENSKRELFEIRLALELGLADFLFMNRNAKDIDTLEQIVTAGGKAKSTQARIQNDIDFHSQLFKMTKNESFIGFQRILIPVFKDVLENIELYHKHHLEKRASHVDLLEILKSGTSEEFRSAMRDHLNPHFHRLKEAKSSL